MQENRQISSYRQALKERILKTAMELFATHGVKAVKMDDIAASLGISKRTLYEIYENKEVLLLAGVKSHHEMMRTQTLDSQQRDVHRDLRLSSEESGHSRHNTLVLRGHSEISHRHSLSGTAA